MIKKLIVIVLLWLLILLSNASLAKNTKIETLTYHSGMYSNLDNVVPALKFTDVFNFKYREWHKYNKFVDAQEDLTCPKGYQLCHADFKFGCVKLKSGTQKARVSRNNSNIFSESLYANEIPGTILALQCETPKYAIDEDLFKLLKGQTNVGLKFESSVFGPRPPSDELYCGLLGRKVDEKEKAPQYRVTMVNHSLETQMSLEKLLQSKINSKFEYIIVSCSKDKKDITEQNLKKMFDDKRLTEKNVKSSEPVKDNKSDEKISEISYRWIFVGLFLFLGGIYTAWYVYFIDVADEENDGDQGNGEANNIP